jgi:hypothetical protein
MVPRLLARSLAAALIGILLPLGSTVVSSVGAATSWLNTLATGSDGEGASTNALTTATTRPATFTVTCLSPTAETATLTWTTAGAGATGYAIYSSTSLAGPYALATKQPAGTALTISETYTTTTDEYYRLEAKSTHWAFPGTTITNAREATVGSTLNGYLAMTKGPATCTAN